MFSIGLSSALKSTALMAAFGVATLASSVAWADNFMDAQWANQVCAKWNQNTTLTTELGDWANNNGGKGYKALQMYRDGCGGATKVELDIAPKEGKAKVRGVAAPWVP